MIRRYLRELNAQVYKVVAQVGTRFLSVYHLALLLQIADLCRQSLADSEMSNAFFSRFAIAAKSCTWSLESFVVLGSEPFEGLRRSN